MREEFESMEDYWQNKLVDERKFYEEQLKTNENQFKELEIRMKEYDEELQGFEMNKSSGDDKLSTIDETSSLEYQVFVLILFSTQVVKLFCRFRSGKKKFLN